MVRLLTIALAAFVVALAAACGGDDDAPADSSSSASPTGGAPTSNSTLDPAQAELREQLGSILLQQTDLPPGLEGGSPIFSTNEDLAGDNAEVLAQLVAAGRQLGADKQFIPTDRLDPAEPAKGGIQSSASIYTATTGATETFQETAAAARANDWAANFPELEGVEVHEMPRSIGDESLWIRVSGLEDCQALVTNTPDPQGEVPSATCVGSQRVVIDNIIFRVGRVRAFIMVSSLFPQQAEQDIYANQIEVYANIVADRAASTFPTS
jgi:hypothetical protein